jgi:uncharacterized protein
MAKRNLELGFWRSLGIVAVYAFIIPFIVAIFTGGIEPDPLFLVIINIISFIILYLWLSKKFNLELKKIFSWKGLSPGPLLLMIITIIGSSILLSECDNIIQHLFPVNKSFMDSYNNIVGGMISLVGSIILAVLIAPIIEELLYRGIILKNLVKRYSPVQSVLISAFIFGLMHLNIWQFTAAFSIGIIIGWWFIETRSLIPCILGHAINNALPFIIIYLLKFKIKGYNTNLKILTFQPAWFDLLGLLLTVGGIIGLVMVFKVNKKSQIPSQLPGL